MILVYVLSICSISNARDFEDMQAEFDKFTNKIQKEHSDFRDKINAEYADFLREAWLIFSAKEAMLLPKSPKPPTQPIYEPDISNPKPQEIPYDDIIIPSFDDRPSPIEPIVEPEINPTASINFDFYGYNCRISLDKMSQLQLIDNKEESVAQAWEELSHVSYNKMLNECLSIRDKLRLCDWGYIKLIQAITRAQYNSDKTYAAIVTQAYILIQSGYKVRIARIRDKLSLLLASLETIYNHLYINIDDDIYYIIDDVKPNDTIELCNAIYPNEKPLSLYLQSQPLFPIDATISRTLSANILPQSGINISVNQNLINFYETFPICKWDIHATASLSDEVKAVLYPYFKRVIDGKSQEEAANILINFVQTGFNYKTDDEQFGYERPLFGDETLFYPYSDCEDRAVLYSILVREILGVDVVLLNYPEHIATAVHFDEDISGDYIIYNDTKYIVCDPTYINASIGLTMPDMDNSVANIILLK